MIWLAMALGCSDDPVPTPTDSATPDGPVRYAQVEDLFARNCAGAGCHQGPQEVPGDPARSTGLDLSAGQAYADLVDVPSHEVPSMVRVAPGDPDASYLFHKVAGTHYEVGGTGDLMPPGFGLAANDVALLEQWIAEGAVGAPR